MKSKSRGHKKELARVISKWGIASRKIAADWIVAGRVCVDGRRVTNPTLPVDPSSAVIELDGRRLNTQQKVYYALNKPRALVTTARDEKGRATVYQCFDPPAPCWVFPVGRLDQASEGLLLFTNDSAWANALLDPASHVIKRYHVQVTPVPTADLVDTLLRGVTAADGEKLAAAAASLLRAGEKNAWLEIELEEGRNRHIRRMLQACDFKVLRLIRIAIGTLELGTLAKGEVRELTAEEVVQLVRPKAPATP